MSVTKLHSQVEATQANKALSIEILEAAIRTNKLPSNVEHVGLIIVGTINTPIKLLTHSINEIGYIFGAVLSPISSYQNKKRAALFFTYKAITTPFYILGALALDVGRIAAYVIGVGVPKWSAHYVLIAAKIEKYLINDIDAKLWKWCEPNPKADNDLHSFDPLQAREYLDMGPLAVTIYQNGKDQSVIIDKVKNAFKQFVNTLKVDADVLTNALKVDAKNISEETSKLLKKMDEAGKKDVDAIIDGIANEVQPNENGRLKFSAMINLEAYLIEKVVYQDKESVSERKEQAEKFEKDQVGKNLKFADFIRAHDAFKESVFDSEFGSFTLGG
jgi:23S rRNA pseudoU1915 N3-methylase RlmH